MARIVCTTTKAEPKQTKITLPCFMKSDADDSCNKIVLMCKSRDEIFGVIVSCNDSRQIGCLYRHVDLDNWKNWKPFYGTITTMVIDEPAS